MFPLKGLCRVVREMGGFKGEDSPIVTLFQWRLIVLPSHHVLVPTFGRVVYVTVESSFFAQS